MRRARPQLAVQAEFADNACAVEVADDLLVPAGVKAALDRLPSV